jgi:hypothetical protein
LVVGFFTTCSVTAALDSDASSHSVSEKEKKSPAVKIFGGTWRLKKIVGNMAAQKHVMAARHVRSMAAQKNS